MKLKSTIIATSIALGALNVSISLADPTPSMPIICKPCTGNVCAKVGALYLSEWKCGAKFVNEECIDIYKTRYICNDLGPGSPYYFDKLRESYEPGDCGTGTFCTPY